MFHVCVCEMYAPLVGFKTIIIVVEFLVFLLAILVTPQKYRHIIVSIL